MMKEKRIGTLVSCLVAGSLMASCGGSSSSTSSVVGAATTSLMVDNIQGTQTDISGAWSDGCQTVFVGGVATLDRKFVKVYSGTSLAITGTDYTSVDKSCTGTANVTETITASLVVKASTTFTNWVDNNGATISGPTAGDGSGPLPNSGALAVVEITVTAATGTASVAVGDVVLLESAVDASGAAAVMYRATNNGTTAAPSYAANTIDPETKALAL